MDIITSTSNERIRHICDLIKNTKARRKEGVFVVEGERIASEIPKEMLKECYVTQEYSVDGKLARVFAYNVKPVVVSAPVFKKMSDTQSPQGILCVCRMRTGSLEDFLSSRKDGGLKLLVLETIQDPGNLGTMIRTAEGAGFDAVIADEKTVDVYNPKVTRSTMGSIFRVPIFYASDALSAVDLLKRENVTLYAAHLQGQNDYRVEKYAERLAFLIGNEGAGLSERVTKEADRLLKIPMKGKLESLNAAIAAAILMYSTE